MKTPHKHAEVIKAWADGAQVQWLNPDAGWEDCDGYQPIWSVSNEYRIKPEPRKGWYRVALATGGFTYTADSDGRRTEEFIESRPDFIRWLTTRTEYEVD